MNKENELGWQFTVWFTSKRRKRWWHRFFPPPQANLHALDNAQLALRERFGVGQELQVNHETGNIAVTLSGMTFPEDSLSLLWGRIAETVGSHAAFVPAGIYRARPVKVKSK